MKIKKYTLIFTLIAALAALTAVSCTNLFESLIENRENASEGNESFVTLSLGDAGVRTALPTLEAGDFTSFKLYGKNITQNDTDWTQKGTWSTYAEMTGASVAVSKENWAFKLEAEKGGLTYVDESSYASGITITQNVTNLSFTLVLSTVGSLTGTGGVNIAVTYPSGAGVQKVTVTVQNFEGTEITAESETNLSVSGSTVTYSNDSLSAGQYKYIFKFYGDEGKTILLGTCTERALVIDGKTSSSTITITSFEAKKSVTYVSSSTDSTTIYYSRLSTLKSDAAKTGRTFAGWYRESNYMGSQVTDSDIANFADSETLYARWGGAVLDVSVPVGSGAGKTFKSAYLHIPGVAIPDFDDDGFDILSGESAVINNHASITLSGKKFVNGTETAIAGFAAPASGSVTLKVQLGAVNASSGTNLASTKLIITLVDTDGNWYLTYIDGANFTAGATAHTATGSALTAFAHSKTATINGQSYTIATHNVGGYSPEDVGTYRQWSASAPSFVVSGFTLPTLSDIENFVLDSATAAATSSQITGLHGYTIGGVFFPAGGYRTSTTADSAGDNYNCELDYWSGTASTINMTDFAYSLTGGSGALTTGVWKKDQYFTVRLIQ